MNPTHAPVKILPLLTDIEYYILMAILIRPRHGIGIFEEVAQQTQNQLILSPGTLYAALKRMYVAGWITLVEPDVAGYPADERRKIYVATSTGVCAAEGKVAWFEHEAARARALFQQASEPLPPSTPPSAPTNQLPFPPNTHDTSSDRSAQHALAIARS
jgi:DNA-binding PadR family transcriptional regulator